MAATFSIVSDTQITATVPSGATTGPISVTGPSGASTSAASFTVISSVATVTVKDYLFKPANFQAAQGQVVRWVFKGPSAHTATDSIGLGPGGRPVVRIGLEGGRGDLRVRVQCGWDLPLRFYEL